MPVPSLGRISLKPTLGESKLFIERINPCEDHLHEHEFLELVYVTHGSAVHQLGTQTFHVQEGDYFIIDYGSFHSYRENDAFEIVNCLFVPEYIDRALVYCSSLSALLSAELRQSGEAPVTVDSADRIYHDADGYVRRLIESMEQEAAQKRIGYLELVRGRLIEILIHTVRVTAETSRPEQRHPAVAAMVEYLHEHFTQPLSLTELSRRMGYAPQYLSSLFARVMGMSPSSYLQCVRIEKSCALLVGSRMRIGQIAQSVGYSDAKYFTAVFRRYMKLSPQLFRSRAKEGIGAKAEGSSQTEADIGHPVCCSGLPIIANDLP